ncbi:unnamed protein product [Urochloa humidicola]
MALAGVAAGASWEEEAPCLVFPTAGETSTFISIANGQTAPARAPDPAMRGHVVLGSFGGWLVTADLWGALRMANPVTGEQADLPAITAGTLPISQYTRGHVVLDMSAFTVSDSSPLAATGRRRGDGSWWRPPLTIACWQMRTSLYRKAVLSSSPRPGRGGGYAAMLILDSDFAAPAFATAGGDPAWRLGRRRPGLRDCIEDAVFHAGRFYSLSYSGAVEAWDRDADTGEYASSPAGPRLPLPDAGGRRKYIAAAPDGRLVAVVKDSRAFKVEERRWRSDQQRRAPGLFEVRVLDAARGRRWEKAADIGDLALFVGVNASMCVSATEHPGIRGGCVYYAEDELGKASLRLWVGEERNGTSPCPSSVVDGDYELRDLGVYVLKDHRAERVVQGIGRHCRWPLPAWFTPSVV